MKGQNNHRAVATCLGADRRGNYSDCKPVPGEDGYKSVGVYADLLFILCLLLELNFAVDKSEEGVIGSHSDVVAGMDGRSSLSYDDVAGKDVGTVSLLDAESLGFAVAAVLGGADAFFMGKELKGNS